MPIASGFAKDRNPTTTTSSNYYIRKPVNTDYLDEQIYYKRELPPEKPVEPPPPPKIPVRPIVKETIFLPDRNTTGPAVGPNRDFNAIIPETGPISYSTKNDPAAKGSFNLIRALGLNADCPCWSWILIIAGIIILLALIGMSLYFVLDRERRV